MSKIKLIRILILTTLITFIVSTSAFANWRYEHKILIHNHTHMAITHVYVIVPPSDKRPTAINKEMLNQIIEPGNSVLITNVIISDHPVYNVNVKIILDNGRVVDKYNVSTTKSFEWTVE